MTDDISIFRIPPSATDAIDGKPSMTPARSKPTAGGPNFQETLARTLGDLSEETDQIAQGTAPSFSEVDKAMDTAKHLYQTSLQAHYIMQELIHGLDETNGKPAGRSPGKEL
ncbi:MAG: hypothetical protein C4527_26220 [Candidatus Omnitrophota bacterium]|jgi:hypothetical protein|nr:MAG: hypothetical protein C4527_26220 [Candidatus Omnitrophota bacterium]